MKSGAAKHLRRALLLSASAWWIGLAGPAVAQQTGSGDVDNSLIRTEGLLPGRNRATMHPGNPLTIVGLEQAGRDLRSGTPALEQSDRAVALVDPEENRRRAREAPHIWRRL